MLWLPRKELILYMAKKRANGEGNIRKRADGRWEGRYTAGFTLSTYTHATEGMKRSAADTIGSVISQTM